MAVLTATGTLVLSQPTPYGGPSGRVPGQILTIFGGSSPLPWFGYGGVVPWEYIPGLNLLGWLMAALTLGFLGYLALNRWRQSRDISIPVVLLTAAGCIFVVSNSLVSLSRVLPIFGPAIILGLAVLSSEIRNRRAAFAVALLCSLPLLRSSSEVIRFLQKPDDTLYDTETGDPADFGYWHVFGYLHLHEDTMGFDWRKHPDCYDAVTRFLPAEHRQRIANQLGLPVASPPP
jgi:hypothetical protein